MPLSGICQVCGKVSHTLSICPYCGSRICITCLDPRTGACLKCKGGVMRK